MTFKMAIIGMNQVGMSIGLAVAEYKDKISTVGFDRSAERLKNAAKLKAVETTSNKLLDCINDSDLILLCEDYLPTLDSLEVLRSANLSGKYLFDVGWNKQAIESKLREFFPGFEHGLHFQLTKNPRYLFGDLADIVDPHPDLFEHGTMALATSASTSGESVELATTLARMLKVEMMFCDLGELDGLLSGSQQLPALLAASLVGTSNAHPGWLEAQKLTGDPYFEMTAPVVKDQDPASTATTFFMNRANLIHWINEEIDQLEQIRDLLQKDDQKPITDWYQKTVGLHQTLVDKRSKADWDQKPVDIERESLSARLGRLIGFSRKKST